MIVLLIGLCTLYTVGVGRCIGEQLAWKWLAPEVMHKRQFRPSSDVWAFGVFVIELLQYGAEPYPGLCTPMTFYFSLLDW